jgi:hypothetical protein
MRRNQSIISTNKEHSNPKVFSPKPNVAKFVSQRKRTKKVILYVRSTNEYFEYDLDPAKI